MITRFSDVQHATEQPLRILYCNPMPMLLQAWQEGFTLKDRYHA